MYRRGRRARSRPRSSASSKLESTLPPEAMQDSNAFRKSRCYNELVDATLRKHQTSLQAIYDVYARANKDAQDELQSSKTMSIGEWLSFVEHLGLLEDRQLSFWGAKIIFKWSLIRACPDHTAKSERMMRQMNFQDFCEALVRLSSLIALPTDAELEAAEAEDAGEYLNALRETGGLLDFVEENKIGWDGQPRQHTSRCVHHLVALLVRTVKQDVHGDEGETAAAGGGGAGGSSSSVRPVSESEVVSFEARRNAGRTLSHVKSKACLLDGVRASASTCAAGCSPRCARSRSSRASATSSSRRSAPTWRRRPTMRASTSLSRATRATPSL